MVRQRRWDAGAQHATQQSSASRHVSADSFLLFDAAPNADGVGKRIRELSANLAASSTTAALALTDREAASLDALLSRYVVQTLCVAFFLC